MPAFISKPCPCSQTDPVTTIPLMDSILEVASAAALMDLVAWEAQEDDLMA